MKIILFLLLFLSLGYSQKYSWPSDTADVFTTQDFLGQSAHGATYIFEGIDKYPADTSLAQLTKIVVVPQLTNAGANRNMVFYSVKRTGATTYQFVDSVEIRWPSGHTANTKYETGDGNLEFRAGSSLYRTSESMAIWILAEVNGGTEIRGSTDDATPDTTHAWGSANPPVQMASATNVTGIGGYVQILRTFKIMFEFTYVAGPNIGQTYRSKLIELKELKELKGLD